MAIRKIRVVGSVDSLPRNPGEIWRPVPGYDGYAVSNQGRVTSLDRKIRRIGSHGDIGWWFYRGKILSPGLTSAGYPHVQIGKGNYNYSGEDVHKFVALAFIGPRPSPDHEVRHYDGNPSNNRVENLFYGTYQEQYDDRVRHGRDNRGTKHYAAKLTEDDVREIRQSSATMGSLARRYGVNRTTIHQIRHRLAWRWLDDDT